MINNKDMLNALRFTLMGLLVALLFVFVFLDSFAANMFNIQFYKDQYARNEIYGFFGDKGYTHQDIEMETVTLMKFLKGRGQLDDFFNETEKDHLKDVQAITREGLALYYSSMALFAVLLILAYFVSKSHKKVSHDFSVVTMLSGGLIIITLFFFALSDFSVLFMKFHEMFFSGNYLFSVDSTLIRLFPLQFFRSITKRIMLHTLIKALALILVGLLPIFLKIEEKNIKMRKLDSLRLSR